MTAAAPEPSPSPHPPIPAGAPSAGPDGETLRQHVERILALIRPTVQADDGDVELVEVSDEGLVRVRFHGACVGSPPARSPSRWGSSGSSSSTFPRSRRSNPWHNASPEGVEQGVAAPDEGPKSAKTAPSGREFVYPRAWWDRA